MNPVERSIETFQDLVRIRTGGEVERCHGIRHHGSYSVAAHTWGALVLLYKLWPEDWARLSLPLMFHDVPEAWVGDIPAPTKRFDPAVKAACDALEAQIFSWLRVPPDSGLSPEDARKVKACDHLELYFWAREQVEGGNGHARGVIRELDGYFAESPLPEEAHLLYLQARAGSHEHRTDGVIRELSR